MSSGHRVMVAVYSGCERARDVSILIVVIWVMTALYSHHGMKTAMYRLQWW